MRIIKDLFRAQSEYKALLSARSDIFRSKKPMLVNGLSEGAKYAFYACLSEDAQAPVLILVRDEKEAVKLSSALSGYGVRCDMFVDRDMSFHNIAHSHEYETERIGILSSILDGTAKCVAATPAAAMQYTMPRQRLSELRRRFSAGDTVDLTELSDYLVSCGYRRVVSVEAVGQFSVRGGIFDVFTPDLPDPVRCELYGDEIDSMGTFDIISQRRNENLQSFSVSPVREVLPDAITLENVRAAIKQNLKKQKKPVMKNLLEGELEAIDNTAVPDFADKYIDIIYPEKESLLDYFDNDGTKIIVCDSPSLLREKVKGALAGEALSVSLMVESGEIAGKYAEYMISEGDFEYKTTQSHVVYVENFTAADRRYGEIFTFRSKSSTSYNESFDLLREDVEGCLANKYAVLLLCENEVVARSYSSMLYEDGIVAPVCGADAKIEVSKLYGGARIINRCDVPGFTSDTARCAVISLYKESSFYNRPVVKKRRGKAKSGSGKKILSYTDLTVGDYVVHDTHGIGVFAGLKTIVGYDKCEREFLQIKYADDGVLYVPCDRLDTLSKYIGTGSAEGTVRLNRMGTGEWERAKARVRSSVRDMAKELITLYAERMKRPGIAFPEDDDLQRQFEETFEYEETEGQLTASDEIKRDMTASHPMDRLLCGDVGFGKTEVALRAVFKAAEAGYQAAILVPTTILALQHYRTILSRMRGFPLEIDMISRFRTAAQQKESLRKLKRGDTDIIVGTHRLLSSDVEFKKLGLIVVDEEQRFGVAHKEKLKQMQTDADVLTLTATPIPRTLSMAISGIRDMSILDEAPGDRLPPQTYVLEYDEIIIADAIKRELRRGGQVFYLFNNVDNIELCAARVHAMCPDAVIQIAHGKMDKEDLSDIWRDVINGDIDILVCTTIIETGVDVPNANTLIIENADKFGLSQLHQLRGRIGRSSRRSYAYFTYRPAKVLSEKAEKRLDAIREYTEFGSGFKIALRDLEIRGAGDILGAEQHGHMDTVGYDTYIKLLNEAVLSEQGTETVPVRECKINLGYSALIPEKYIFSEQLRIEMYKKISHIASSEDLDDVADELLDRFGEIPRETGYLLYVSLLRSLGERLGVSHIDKVDNKIVIHVYEFDAEKWVKVTSVSHGRLMIYPGREPVITYTLKSKDDPLRTLTAMLELGLNELK